MVSKRAAIVPLLVTQKLQILREEEKERGRKREVKRERGSKRERRKLQD
jgi:hypothetical protein